MTAQPETQPDPHSLAYWPASVNDEPGWVLVRDEELARWVAVKIAEKTTELRTIVVNAAEALLRMVEAAREERERIKAVTRDETIADLEAEGLLRTTRDVEDMARVAARAAELAREPDAVQKVAIVSTPDAVAEVVRGDDGKMAAVVVGDR